MTDEAQAFAGVRVSLEKLRRAALDAVAAVGKAEAEGLSLDAILEAVRMDAADWTEKLPLMKTAHDLLSAVGARTRLDMVVLIDDPIATDAEMIKYEKEQGILAYHIGQKISECPYAPSDPASSTWRQGWLEAKDARND